MKMTKWKPKVGETYYMPWLYDCELDCIDIIWNGTSFDEKRYASGFVCRTMKEALDVAEKMLAVARGVVMSDTGAICLNCDWGIENGARDAYWCKCPKQTGSRDKDECDTCEHFKVLKNIRYYYEIKEIMDRYRADPDTLEYMLWHMKRIDANRKKREQEEAKRAELTLLPFYRPEVRKRVLAAAKEHVQNDQY